MENETKSLGDLIVSPLHGEGFKQLFALMRSSGFTKLVYSFDGSGDSGTLESSADDYEGFHAERKPSDVSCSLILQEPGGLTVELSNIPGAKPEWKQLWNDVQANNLEELGYQLANIVLNNDPHDWYNNDGGFGKIEFHITPEGKNRVFCDMNTRVVESIGHPDEVEFDG